MNDHYKAVIYTILSILGISTGILLSRYLPLSLSLGSLAGYIFFMSLIGAIYCLFRASFSTNKIEVKHANPKSS